MRQLVVSQLRGFLRMGVVLFAVLILSGCSSTEERRSSFLGWFDGLMGSGSGVVVDVKGQVQDVIDTGMAVKEGVEDMVEGVKDRVEKVQKGVEMLQDGKDLIEEGIGN